MYAGSNIIGDDLSQFRKRSDTRSHLTPSLHSKYFHYINNSEVNKAGEKDLTI